MNQSVFLVGPMGVGKSTIGKLLAVRLQLPFVDSDRLLEANAGADIPWIFDIEGEEGFRRRESALLKELCKGAPRVIATGGGIILMEQNRRWLCASGRVVYLHASLEPLLERTAKSNNRPLLQVADPRERIKKLLEERESLYRQVADLICETDNSTPRQTVNKIADQLQGGVLCKS